MSISADKLSKIAHAADDLYGAKIAIQGAFEEIIETLQDILKRLEKVEERTLKE